jgi:hypothetical protein
MIVLFALGYLRKESFIGTDMTKKMSFSSSLKDDSLIELENETITLQRHQGFTIPKVVLHKTGVPEPTSILMMEAATVKPTGY